MSSPVSHNVAVPGNVTSHYQPNTRVRLVQASDLALVGVQEDRLPSLHAVYCAREY
nr:hypothetical protein [Vibrio sp. 03_296]